MWCVLAWFNTLNSNRYQDPSSVETRHGFWQNGKLVFVSKMNLSPQETAAYTKLFKLADTTGTGIVTGAEAVAFLSKSGLSQDLLRQVA